jgi:hypothetical protein
MSVFVSGKSASFSHGHSCAPSVPLNGAARVCSALHYLHYLNISGLNTGKTFSAESKMVSLKIQTKIVQHPVSKLIGV